MQIGKSTVGMGVKMRKIQVLDIYKSLEIRNLKTFFFHISFDRDVIIISNTNISLIFVKIMKKFQVFK